MSEMKVAMTPSWDEFIIDRIDQESAVYRTTKEYRHRKTVEDQMDEMLTTNLTQSERTLVDEVLFAKGLMQEQDGERLYRQGMRDCVAVLKELGVLG